MNPLDALSSLQKLRGLGREEKELIKQRQTPETLLIDELFETLRQALNDPLLDSFLPLIKDYFKLGAIKEPQKTRDLITDWYLAIDDYLSSTEPRLP